MLDFMGKELIVDDIVILIAPKYRHLVKGKILRFTAKYAIIEYFNDWNYGKEKPWRFEIKQEGYQLVKV